MKRTYILILFLSSIVAFGQANILNAKSPDEIGQKSIYDEIDSDNSPLPYGFISEKDVIFSKTIWEEINLDERVNFPMLYPIDTVVVGNERRPLLHYLLKSALEGDFPVYQRDNFKDVLTIPDLKQKLIYQRIYNGDGLNIGLDRIVNEAGNKEQFLINAGVDIGEYSEIDELDPSYPEDEYAEYLKRMDELIFENKLLREEEYAQEQVGYADVQSYRIKGVWYFDKRQSDLRYRPIAIAPVVITPRSKDLVNNNTTSANVELETVDLFWVFYPDVRPFLHNALSFNNKNTSKPISFDHLINSRRFSGFIYKEDNVYEDRDINDYLPENALLQLLESQRIREKIRNLEQDMWSY